MLCKELCHSDAGASDIVPCYIVAHGRLQGLVSVVDAKYGGESALAESGAGNNLSGNGNDGNTLSDSDV